LIQGWTFIAGALFRKAAGIDLLHVPFKSVPEAISAVIRGDAHMYFSPTNMAREQSEGGKVNVLGVVTAARVPELSNVPTFKETGVDYVYDAWFGLMAPAGVPKDIIAKVNRDVVAILQSPEMKAKLAAQALVASPDTPEQFDMIIKDDTARMTEIWKGFKD